jgi:hypothetical protein
MALKAELEMMVKGCGHGRVDQCRAARLSGFWWLLGQRYLIFDSGGSAAVDLSDKITEASFRASAQLSCARRNLVSTAPLVFRRIQQG